MASNGIKKKTNSITKMRDEKKEATKTTGTGPSYTSTAAAL